ncbi:MAG: hypothetical protein K2Q10_11320 [Rhodospirillales bacterium]|nr:hypothetical protein [Rhodospirillales bacterium]
MVPPVRYYCSYFDHRYLPRGLVMMDSIWRHTPAARFFVLCLDDECKRLLDLVGHPNITAIPLAELEKADTELRAAKENRSLVEYYFTCTPCWPNYLLKRFPEIDLITYLDADLLFYADPEIVHEEIAGASIAIIPHRFSPERLHLKRYGLFNVGWVSWRNDEEGRRCLSDYRTDCIAWCYDRLEDGRFADQKYLDTWPDKYPALRSIEHIGVNLAAWNINNYTLSIVDNYLFVNDKRVVFYHFHALRETEDGRWHINLDEQMRSRHRLLTEKIFSPYVNLLRTKGAELEKQHGPVRKFTDIRYARKAIPGTPGWFHIGQDWPDTVDPQAGGWSFDTIAEIRKQQVAEFRKRPPIVAAGNTLLEQANSLIAVTAFNHVRGQREDKDASLSILDWGGALGLTGEVLRRMVPGAQFDYTVKEVDELCRVGAELMPGITFTADHDKALAGRYDLVIASAALHYNRDWQSLVTGLANAARHGLLIARQPTVRDIPSYVARQNAYGTAFTCWVLNERQLVETFHRCGLKVACRFLSGDGAQIKDAPKQPTFHSYVLERMRDLPAGQS